MLWTIVSQSSQHLLGYAISVTVCFYVWKYVKVWRKRTRYTTYQQCHGCEDPPVLPTIPGLGSLMNKLTLLSSTGDDLLDDIFPSKYNQYGSTHAIYKDRLPKVVHTVDTKILQAITSTNAQDWRHPPARRNVIYPLFQRGIVTTEGGEHHRNRKAAQRHMIPKYVRDVSRNEPDVQRFFRIIGKTDDQLWTREVDVLELFTRMTLDMTISYLLGTSANAQENGIRQDMLPPDYSKKGWSTQLSADASIDDVFHVLIGWFVWRRKLGSLYWLADTREYRKACQILINRFQNIIDDAHDKRKAEAKNNNSTKEESDGQQSPRNLLEGLLDDTQDPERTREIIMDLFVAGQAMVGTAAGWLFACLAEHPEVVQSIRDEIMSTFGTENDPKQDITWQALLGCEKLQNAIHETLRLYPLLPGLSRTAAVDTVLPSGGGDDASSPIAVRKGTTVMVNVYMIHRDEKYFGAEPNEFRPERWRGRKTGSEYMPFGAGPRQCIGRDLSYAQLSYMTVRILQRYSEIKAPVGTQNLSKHIAAIMRPRDGVKLKFKLAS